MSVKYNDFQNWVIIAVKRFPFYGTTNINNELNAISTALTTDTTLHDATIETPPAALKLAVLANTDFTDEILALVNKGKSGNLSSATMAQAIDGVTGALAAPGNIDIPYVSGATPVGSLLTCTQGNWAGTPSSYAYAWKRDGTTAVGTNANTYTTVAGDQTHLVTCVVSATNATGTTAAPPSNGIRVT